MGRALFSQNYSSVPVPAVHEEPDPANSALNVPCEKWSVWNQFDPDSEDFFQDAQLERFIDGPVENSIEADNVSEAPHVVVLEDVRDDSSSPSSASSDDSNDVFSDDNDSPMAVGTDDPASLLAGAYTPVDWQQRFLEAGSDPHYQSRPTRIPHRGPRRIGNSRQYTTNIPDSHLRSSTVSVFVPPAPYRTVSSTSATAAPAAPMRSQDAPTHISARSPVSRRTVSITPINIPSEPSLPSPVSPTTPTNPSPHVVYPTTTNNLVTPSPAPNTTPRIYTWNRFPGMSPSPTRDSPLTNPRARLSLSRIDTLSTSMGQRSYSAPVAVYDHV